MGYKYWENKVILDERKSQESQEQGLLLKVLVENNVTLKEGKVNMRKNGDTV